MGSEQVTAKRPTNIYISADLVSRAKAITPSLSQTVEMLLEVWVAAEEARRNDHVACVAQWVAASNATLARAGSPDEWSQF
ncbi:type II toxin-antitoxin system CcdA family antitoxin [Acidisphaera sp. L21]|uniref:type II toxin-antitoxin system CcdA family antitoxin n=1 Tax=Acidisphaera sp. L21 TaxID=1641851 RepID=UPI00131C6615|nr:type II toxin-antitoxin system CcdA family antitoxin [Acidisphaera sp. L21]